MGRLGAKPAAATLQTTELDQPDHLPKTPPPTTTSAIITSSHPPEVPRQRDEDQPLPQHPSEDKDNEPEIVEVVDFPPRPSVSVDALPRNPDKQMVVYVPPGTNIIPPSGGTPSSDQDPAVMFPPQKPANPVYGQPNDVAGQNVLIVPNAGNQQLQQQPQSQNSGSMPPVILVPFVGVPWHSGLFDCCQQPTNAFITAFAPCVTFGQIAEILDNGSTSCLTGAFLYIFLFLVLCHWNIGVRYRRRMRNAFQIAETPVTDRIAHVMFPLCALCQEFRELQHRGLDPFQGYQGVIAAIVHGQNTPNVPPAYQSMTRV